MYNKKTGGKAKIASNKALLARVTKEMAQPRITQSAQTKPDKQIKPMDSEHPLSEIHSLAV
jgi:hypothetical protein